ncbi:hypothetical protein XELAEV_18006604mg [Xenopus laevis]|uniref:Uncharacterized protein n=1 Tax=Xenopus laevis TaxID=8355 RepID=A0A974E0V6_XENLA|nr:hypothetical protein XELAEV_18006604mg [Xenopus laevis]
MPSRQKMCQIHTVPTDKKNLGYILDLLFRQTATSSQYQNIPSQIHSNYKLALNLNFTIIHRAGEHCTTNESILCIAPVA